MWDAMVVIAGGRRADAGERCHLLWQLAISVIAAVVGGLPYPERSTSAGVPCVVTVSWVRCPDAFCLLQASAALNPS